MSLAQSLINYTWTS